MLSFILIWYSTLNIFLKYYILFLLFIYLPFFLILTVDFEKKKPLFEYNLRFKLCYSHNCKIFFICYIFKRYFSLLCNVLTHYLNVFDCSISIFLFNFCKYQLGLVTCLMPTPAGMVSRLWIEFLFHYGKPSLI